ncbi:hypothetical protein [Metabacillus idriensis]|uniref:hypothetical protein n=1 Tax=Metabacillus idriensis TaxID=324768 RepID=UPI00174CE608|nr:hypothetical protein [Metabacillus idriensis]
MSITTMLKGKKEFDIELQTILWDIIPTKKEFCTVLGTEAFSSKYSILAPYILNNPYQSSVVGTAFDYMARFIVSQKITSNKDNVLVGLTARNGLEIMKKYCDKKTCRSLETKLNDGIILINKFINHRDMSFEEILPYATYMARLEHIYRSRVLPKEIKGSMLGAEESAM